MTIKIEIEVPSDLVLKGIGSEYLDRAAGALGFYRTPAIGAQHREAVMTTQQVRDADDATAAREAKIDEIEPVVRNEERSLEEEAAEVKQILAGSNDAPALDKRPVGSPAGGNKRRNSAEKAEDDEFEKLAAEKNISLDKLNAGIAAVGRSEARSQLEALEAADKDVTIASMKMLPDDATPEQVAREFAAISTGENRIGPEDEQDAADEAAETEKSGLAPIDVLRRLLGDYQKKHGMPAAVKLCQEGGLIGAPIHELDDAGIEKAIAAMSVSSLSSEAKAEPKPVEKVAPKSKGDLIEAMMRYGDKFDGTREQAKMVHTLADCPRIFTEVFGDAVTKLSQVPEDGYGKAVAAIEQAIASDPFGRAK